MKFNYKPFALLGLAATILVACGSTSDILTTPIENIDTSPLKVTDLTEVEKNNWGHLDLVKDTIPGMAIIFFGEMIVLINRLQLMVFTEMILRMCL
jgi:hypothetical protein